MIIDLIIYKNLKIFQHIKKIQQNNKQVQYINVKNINIRTEN